MPVSVNPWWLHSGGLEEPIWGSQLAYWGTAFNGPINGISWTNQTRKLAAICLVIQQMLTAGNFFTINWVVCFQQVGFGFSDFHKKPSVVSWITLHACYVREGVNNKKDRRNSGGMLRQKEKRRKRRRREEREEEEKEKKEKKEKKDHGKSWNIMDYHGS